MASPKKISSYKAYTLDPIYRALKAVGWKGTRLDIETRLKNYTEMNKSCSDMNDLELDFHIHWSRHYAELAKLDIDFEKDKRLDLDFNRTNKN